MEFGHFHISPANFAQGMSIAASAGSLSLFFG
jgi:hypothetical protein